MTHEHQPVPEFDKDDHCCHECAGFTWCEPCQRYVRDWPEQK